MARFKERSLILGQTTKKLSDETVSPYSRPGAPQNPQTRFACDWDNFVILILIRLLILVLDYVILILIPSVTLILMTT